MTAAVALNRFGLGARPGEIAAVRPDPRGWLHAQLRPETALPAPMAALPSTVDDLGAFRKWTAELARSARARGMDPATMRSAPADRRRATTIGSMAGAAAGDDNNNGDDVAAAAASMRAQASGMSRIGADGLSVEGSFKQVFGPRHARALKARFDVAVATERPFFERLVHFWSNHFVVSGAKPGAIAMPPSFERDAIRPHVTGRFVDMLLASTKHPAMLFYLDNLLSIGPNSALAQNPALRRRPAQQDFAIPRSIGLNENLAREILELQTLGARGGYDQADVTSLARIITGWTIARPPRVSYARLTLQGRLNGPGLFDFDPDAHEPGVHRLLGVAFAQPGVAQGEAALRALAAHPSTARFIATKLARHFVTDDPPPEVVERLATVFRDTDGDLARVCAALVDLPQGQLQPLQKFKTPQEFLVSAARGLPGLDIDATRLQRTLANLGQVVYNPPGPNGWPDVEAEWLGADAVWKRFLWAGEAASAVASGTLAPAALARELLGDTVSAATLQAIERAESPTQGLTLLLASAEFQRR
ncbi:MAG: DUF1800 domain-containing protein [Rhodoferax sp.]|nr:DUF1800 domain-containing protein [Rhodoferax sp.]